MGKEEGDGVSYGVGFTWNGEIALQKTTIKDNYVHHAGRFCKLLNSLMFFAYLIDPSGYFPFLA